MVFIKTCYRMPFSPIQLRHVHYQLNLIIFQKRLIIFLVYSRTETSQSLCRVKTQFNRYSFKYLMCLIVYCVELEFKHCQYSCFNNMSRKRILFLLKKKLLYEREYIINIRKWQNNWRKSKKYELSVANYF